MAAKSETLVVYLDTEIKIKKMRSAINVQGFTAPSPYKFGFQFS